MFAKHEKLILITFLFLSFILSGLAFAEMISYDLKKDKSIMRSFPEKKELPDNSWPKVQIETRQ